MNKELSDLLLKLYVFIILLFCLVLIYNVKDIQKRIKHIENEFTLDGNNK